MRRLLPRTFFWQLVLGTMAAQVLLLGVFISYTISSARATALERMRERTIGQLNRLAGACEKQLAHGNMHSLHDVLELSRIAPTIDVARVTDLEGHTLAVSGSGRDPGLDRYERTALRSGTGQRVFTIGNGQMEAVTPIVKGGKTVALLWLEPNHSISLNTARAVVRVALNYGGFALLANILPIFLIVRTMTRPLRRLREATQRLVLQPDKSAGFPLPVTTTNEAGELTRSFNTMVHELEEQRGGLLDTLALLDSMLGNAPIGLAFFDRELRFVRLNQFLAAMFGRPAEQLLKQSLEAMGPASLASEIEAYLSRVFHTGEAIRNVEFSSAVQGAPELRQTWLMHFYPVRTQVEAVRWVGVIMVDITDRLRAEEMLRKTEKLAATGRLAASIAHEINNPLEAVTNLLYLLGTHSPMDGTALEFVSAAQAELARVSEITQQTLRFYRQSTSPARVRLAEVLRSVVALYRSRLQAAHVHVSERFRFEPEVFGYGGELRQVFANLVGNAVDAMPKGGELILRVRPSCGRGPDGNWCTGVRACIADTGTGMSRETMAKIFEAFFTTKQATGTGLGLWVSDEIVRKHAGTVRVRSRQGVNSGTAFMLFFPDGGMGLPQGEAYSAGLTREPSRNAEALRFAQDGGSAGE